MCFMRQHVTPIRKWKKTTTEFQILPVTNVIRYCADYINNHAAILTVVIPQPERNSVINYAQWWTPKRIQISQSGVVGSHQLVHGSFSKGLPGRRAWRESTDSRSDTEFHFHLRRMSLLQGGLRGFQQACLVDVAVWMWMWSSSKCWSHVQGGNCLRCSW